jgi:hypothetical protein
MATGSVPTRMYQIQGPAYDAADAYGARTTDSTPTTPPTFTPADMSAACARKQFIVDNLPDKCGHCNLSFSGASSPCVVETKDGSIIAYCKASGGCALSHVLFVPPDASVPHYEQVCVFDPVAGHESLNDMAYTLHGVMPGTMPCSRCGETWRDHKKEFDTNGWRVSHYENQSLPQEWPIWQAATASWSKA